MNTKLIRKQRREKEITLQQLAEKTGFSKGYLSRIENAENLPPFSTLQKIANALGVELTEFIESKQSIQASTNIDLIIAGKNNDTMSAIGGYSYQKMVNTYKGKYMLPLLMEIAPGKTGQLRHDGEEFVFVVRGDAVLEYEGNQYTLPEKSGAYLDSRIKHAFINNKKTPLTLLAVNYNYRRF